MLFFFFILITCVFQFFFLQFFTLKNYIKKKKNSLVLLYSAEISIVSTEMCSVSYHPSFLESNYALDLQMLLERTCIWKVEGGRKSAWYGEKLYKYGSVTQNLVSMPFETALELLKTVNLHFNTKCNSVLANHYQSGLNYIPWHSDDEASLGDSPTIVSLSLGGPRRFLLKEKATDKTIEVLLENGSAIVMEGKTQERWLHCIPRDIPSKSRINLTVRQIM
jgi:alkylated DNA repair dioxygenase AlkB